MSAIAPDASLTEEEQPSTPKRSSRFQRAREGFKWWHAAVALSLIVGVALAIWLLPVKDWLIASLKWIDGLGWIGPLVFTAIYVPAVLLGLPSTPLNIGSGLMFGALIGTLATTAGAVLGGIIGFLLARYLLGDWVQKKIDCYPKCSKAIDACEHSPWTFLTLLRMHPLIPSSLKNYCLGTTQVPVIPFLVTTLLASLPIRAVYAYLGSAGHMTLKSDNETSTTEWILYGVGLGVAILMTIGLTWFARKKIKELDANCD